MDKEFDKAIGEERDWFVISVLNKGLDNEMRTAAESLLVMYDQMRDRLREQPLREALERIHEIVSDDTSYGDSLVKKYGDIKSIVIAARTPLDAATNK